MHATSAQHGDRVVQTATVDLEHRHEPRNLASGRRRPPRGGHRVQPCHVTHALLQTREEFFCQRDALLVVSAARRSAVAEDENRSAPAMEAIQDLRQGLVLQQKGVSIKMRYRAIVKEMNS